MYTMRQNQNKGTRRRTLRTWRHEADVAGRLGAVNCLGLFNTGKPANQREYHGNHRNVWSTNSITDPKHPLRGRKHLERRDHAGLTSPASSICLNDTNIWCRARCILTALKSLLHYPSVPQREFGIELNDFAVLSDGSICEKSFEPCDI